MAYGLGLGLPFQYNLVAGVLLPANLDLNFTSGTLNPLVTFTRASSGSYFDSAGVLQTASTNVPRFDYDPVTLAARGLRIEEQRTNLLLRSNEITTTPWTAESGASFVASDVVTAIDGTLTADQVVFNVNDSSAIFYQVYTGAFGTTYTHSIWVRLSSGTGQLAIRVSRSDKSTITQAAHSISSAWKRITVSGVADTTGLSLMLRAATDIVGVTVYFCYAQAEAGADVTSNILTSASQATRSADVVSIALPSACDLLVQDGNGGEWRPGISAGAYNLLPRAGSEYHVKRVRAYPPGTAAAHPELAVAA